MALWGISTSTETAANNYNIPKYKHEVDRNRTPWNTFADCRGWIYRRYKTTEQSGISTRYCDEVLVTVSDLNITNTGGSYGLGVATPVAVFFEDPNKASPISIGAGGTTGISTGTTGYVHVVFNELVFAGAGATVNIRTFDANGNESTALVGTAYSNGNTQYGWVGYAASHGSPNVYTNYNGQITNRVAFAFTATSALSANVNFLTTTTGANVAAGSTVVFVNSISNVAVGSSLSVTGKLTNVPVVSIGDTFVRIGTGSTIATSITSGTSATFSTFTRATTLRIDTNRGFVGVITDGSTAVNVNNTFTNDILRNVGGAGTTGSVGIGTTTLTVTP